MTLEAFQSGLAWITILRKRENFRAAFAGFEIARVAAFGEDDVARLMADAGIVRNRLKIEAAIANARAALDVDLAELIWSFAPEPRPPGRAGLRGAAGDRRPSPRRWRRRLRSTGFRFVGPDHRLRDDAGLRAGRRPLRGLPCVLERLTGGGSVSAAELLRRGGPRRRWRPRRGRTCSSTSSRRSTGGPRSTAARGRWAAPADLEMLLGAARRRRRRADRPGHGARRGLRPAAVGPSGAPTPPPAVLISRRFDIPWEAGLFAARRPAGDRLRAGRRGPAPPDVAAPVEVVRLDECTPAAALADLRGARRARAVERGRARRCSTASSPRASSTSCSSRSRR